MKVKKLLAVLLMSAMLTACSINGGDNKPSDGGNTPVEPSDGGEGQGGGEGEGGGQQQVTLASISVTAPTKTQYFVGDQALDLAGLVVTAHYSDNSTAAIATGYEVSNVDFSEAGQKTVTVTYEGKTDSFNITVSAVVLSSITVTAPTKTEYFAGDEIDLTGMVVTANYNNGSTVPLTEGFTTNVSEINMNEAGQKTVTVSYEQQTDSFNINVTALAIVSISATAPTKAEYAVGEAVDLAGMVVTATYNNGDTATLTEGYTTNEASIDMKASGDKTITVTYGELTCTVSIHVSAPTDWGTAEKALFAQYLYGLNFPYFYAYDLGVGDLQWYNSKDIVVAQGGVIEADAQQVLAEPEAVYQLLKAAGWQDVVNPTSGKKYDGSYYWDYRLSTTFKVEGEDREVMATFGAYYPGHGFTYTGYFMIQLRAPYYYSWAETGYGAAIPAYFESEIAIPSLPNGKYVKSVLDANNPAQTGYLEVDVLGVTTADLTALLEAFNNSSDWEIVEASANSGVDYVAMSSDKKMLVDIVIYQGEVDFYFKAPSISEEVAVVAADLDLPAFAFYPYDETDYEAYEFETTLGAGQTLAQLRDAIAEDLVGTGATYQFSAVGTPEANEEIASGKYLYEDGDLKVDARLEVSVDEEGAVTVAVYVKAYEAPDAKTLAIIAALGCNQYDFDKGTHGWYMNLPLDNTLDDDGMKAVIQGYFTNLYAATELDFAPLMDEIADGGDDDWYFEAANDDTKVQVWVYPTFDEDENVEEIRLNISISAFNPPESALKDAMLTVLGIKLRWSEDQQHYGLNGTATIDWANNESWGDVVEGYVNALYAAAVEGSPLEDIELLSFNEGSMYAEAWLYTEEGYIVLQCWSSDKGTDGEYGTADDEITTLFEVVLFDANVPLSANAIALPITQELSGYGFDTRMSNQNGHYIINLPIFVYNGYYYIVENQEFNATQAAQFASIMFGYAISLLPGFVLQGEIAADANGVVSATYLNSTTGAQVILSLPLSAQGLVTTIQVEVVLPAPSGD